MKLALILAVLALTGCSNEPEPKSGDPWTLGINNSNTSNNGTSNNGTSNNGTSNNGTSNNGTSNNGTVCDGPPPGCGTCEAPVCDAGSWSCLATPCPQPDCEQFGGSDLPGVSIAFDGDRCSWTVDEVAQGIVIPYTITIEEALDVSVSPGQSGCEQPGPGNLKPAFTISGGNGQLYCLCDQGLCGGGPETVVLDPGVYSAEIEWSGRNWSGPSDTGNPMGDPFPPGDYQVEVAAGGDFEQTIFQVYQTLNITLTE